MATNHIEISRPRKLVSGLILTIFLIAVLEIIIRLVLPSSQSEFSRAGSGADETITFAPAGGAVVFPARKPAGCQRVFFFGESACAGTPFVPGGGFPEWFELLGNLTLPERPVEAINFGVNGTTSRDILFRLNESLQFEPDLIVLYIGNNESQVQMVNPQRYPLLAQSLGWLGAHSAIARAIKGLLWVHRAEMAMLMMSVTNKRGMDDIVPETPILIPRSRRKEIDDAYRSHLQQMVDSARSRGIPVIVVPPAANIRDWPPIRSVHQDVARDPAASERETEIGRKKLASGDSAAAISHLEQALRADPGYAETSFLLGVAREQRGDREGAMRAYEEAREWDDYVLRSPTRFKEIGREVGADLFLDADRLMIRPDGPPAAGYDTFCDFVHLNLVGNYLLALRLLEALELAGRITLGPLTFPSYQEARPQLDFPASAERQAYADQGLMLGFLFQHESRIRQALVMYRAAENGGMLMPILAQAVLHARLNNSRAAGEHLSRAVAISPPVAASLGQRLFPGILEICDQQAMISVTGADWSRVVRAVLQPESGTEPPPECSGMRLVRADYAYIVEGPGKFRDITDLLPGLRSAREQATPITEVSLLDPVMFMPRYHALTASAEGTFNALNDDANLTIRGAFPDITRAVLIIDARISPTGPGRPDNRLTVYWTGAGCRQFSESCKVDFAFPADGRRQRIKAPLGGVFRMLLSRPITSLRFDFTNFPAAIEINSLVMGPDELR